MPGNLGRLDKAESRNVWTIVATALPLAVLAIPSLWLMLSVSPLWRDVDAYNQTVRPPGMVTILLHAPLYCTLSRIPLWFGYLISGSGPVVSLGHFIKHSQLTDAGVYSLVVLQHVALWCGAVYLIYAIARALLLRLFLAVLFASQPLLYAFAHCVGSEALSMILMLFLAGSGARVMLRYPEVPTRDWIIFTALIAGAALTRHINCVLAAVLPITAIAIAAELWLRLVASKAKATPAANVTVPKVVQVLLICIASGTVGLLLASSVTHLFCWRARTPWRSTFGYTFLWRFNFLDMMQPASRRQLLDTIASRCKVPESREMVKLLGDWMDQNKYWEPGAFIQEAHSNLSEAEMKFHSEKFDRALNDIAWRFLYPPVAPLRLVALSDFGKAMELNESDIVETLFVNTDYFFSHRDKMPQCAGLKTFRQPRDRLINARKLSYFQWWSLFSCRTWGIVGFVLFVSALIVDYKRGRSNAPIILYAASLSVVGIGMALLNCFFAQLQPRYALPMMELLLLSVVILVGVFLGGLKAPEDELRRT